MTLTRKLAALGIAFVAAALIFSAFATSTDAQTPTPAPPKATVTATPAPTTAPTAAAPAAAPKAAAPAKTGNAGLLGSTGTSMALVLMMGIAAAALVAGARTATRER